MTTTSPNEVTLEGYVTAPELAEMAGITLSSLYKYVQRGNVPSPFRLRRALLWPLPVAKEWAETRRRWGRSDERAKGEE